jgi:four helix bundle protein
MPLQTYRDLKVWQKAMDLVEQIYTLTKTFPDEERFGLTSQMRRAAVSVPANIAEGYGRKHRGDYLHHLSMARGSLMELETHLMIAVRLRFCTDEHLRSPWETCQETGKMLNGLISSLNPVP